MAITPGTQKTRHSIIDYVEIRRIARNLNVLGVTIDGKPYDHNWGGELVMLEDWQEFIKYCKVLGDKWGIKITEETDYHNFNNIDLAIHKEAEEQGEL